MNERDDMRRRNATIGKAYPAFFLAAVLSAAVSPAHAQTVDTSEWICEFCPFAAGHEGDYEVGASSVSDDAAWFGDASGYDEDGAYLDVSGHGSYAGEDNRLRWTLEDLGLDSRHAALDGAWSDKLRYTLDYRELPRRRYFTTSTIFSDGPGNSLELPANWVTAPTTAGFTELDGSLSPRDIESDRRTFSIGGRYFATDRLRFSASLRRRDQDGNGVYGGGYFTQASLLPGRFDYVTDEVDLGMTYTAERGFVSLGWSLSDFDSAAASLRWEIPFTSPPGAERAALAQPPDNSFQQAALSGNYRFPRYDTVVAVSGAIGTLKQNEPFLPYTTNDQIATELLPRSHLDADIDTANFALALTSRVTRKGRIKMAYRYSERDNRTAQDTWTRVIADSFPTNDMELNVPYSFERSTLNLSADYDLADSIRVSAGYDRKTIDRDFQEVAGQTEDGGWARLRWRPAGSLEIDVRGGTAKRDIDAYNEEFALTLGQNPLLRKYNLAYRYRQFGEVSVSASLPEHPVTVTLTGRYADDSYSQSQLGLLDADDLSVAADLSLQISETVSAFVNGSYEDIESNQAGSAAFGAPDWRAVNRDRFYTAGAGLRLRQAEGKYGLQFEYTHSDGTSEIDMSSDASGDDRFPDISSTMDYLRLRLSYRHSERLQVSGTLRYQRFVAEDWALQGVGPGTIPTVLSLGAAPYDEDRFIFGIGFRYRISAAGAGAGE